MEDKIDDSLKAVALYDLSGIHGSHSPLGNCVRKVTQAKLLPQVKPEATKSRCSTCTLTCCLELW